MVLGTSEQLMGDTAYVRELNWISGEKPGDCFRCSVKIRYRQKEQPATVYVQDADCIKIVFDRKQRALTPGQAAVLYDGDVVLGGGVIQ